MTFCPFVVHVLCLGLGGICFLSEAVRMHFVNGRKCEVKKALPRDDESLSSVRAGTSELC